MSTAHDGDIGADARTAKDWILLREVHQHNLRIGELAIPRQGVSVITGVSGSGKSSLAFDTIHAEGYRQYLESLSAYVRRKLPKVPKPDAGEITGLSPTVAIEQRTISRNPRSNVGTITEISDRIRLLFSRAGHHRCRTCGEDVHPRDVAAHTEELVAAAAEHPLDLRAPGDGRVVMVLGPAPDAAQVTWLRELLGPALRGEGLDAYRDGSQVRHVRADWICPGCGSEARATSSHWFTPNSLSGMCDECQGLGDVFRVDPRLLVADEDESIRAGALSFFGDRRRSKKTWWPLRELPDVLRLSGTSLDTPWRLLPAGVRELILFGTARSPLPPELAAEFGDGGIEGLAPSIQRLFRDADSPERKSFYEPYMSSVLCTVCHGTRHHPEALSVRLGGLNIAEVNALPAARLGEWLDGVRDEVARTELAGIGEELIEQTEMRLRFMLDVSLHYLTLDRPAPSLSAGEGQRLRLARQLGSGLVGVTYVLDEPSIGLHPRDNGRLIGTLRSLAGQGNAVIVVEHDRETMESADYLVDLGPGPGSRGGLVVAAGPTADVIADPASATAAYLRNELAVRSPRPGRRTPGERRLEVRGAHLHNLRKVDVRIPVGLLTGVTGVSGSGKSSLVTGTIEPALSDALRRRAAPSGPFAEMSGQEHFDRVVTVTQDSLGGSSRSTPATYAGVFDEIRKVFARTPEAVARRYSIARFSFNAERGGGRCDRCSGKGVIRIEMLFLADFTSVCPACEGRRYAPETLEIRHRGLDIAQTLDLEVSEALRLYEDHPQIARPLQVLCDVGLGYLQLGQSTTELSGGEAQRLKLSRELTRPGEGRTLYLIDEPTTGLHFSDVQVLLGVVHDLVDRGNTVIVIEHSAEFVSGCDWVIDLGPGGGPDGGTVVAAGTPEHIARSETSAMAPFLAAQLRHLNSTGGRAAEAG